MTQMDTDRNAGSLHSVLTEAIIGCFYSVYNELGYGFLESVYEKAMVIELRKNGLAAEPQLPIKVFYQGEEVGDFRADILVNHLVLIELKAARQLEPMFEAQLLNYLKASDMEVGLLLNFGPRPQIRRFIFDNWRKQVPVSSV